MKKYFYLFITFLMLVVFPAEAQNKTTLIANDTLALDPAVRYGKLPNGFTYYIRRNDAPKGEIELHMVVKAGRFHEDEDQLEYAHLMEHMGAKGTVHFPRTPDFFKFSGGYNHAGTRQDHTYYWGKIPSDDTALLKNGLQIVRDWAQGILLEPESIDVERGAVLGEMRTNDPYARWKYETFKNFMLHNTGHSPYDKEKHVENIRNFRREPFIRFYNDWYRPDLEAAIIVGDIDVDSVEQEIKCLFFDLKMPKNPKDARMRVAANELKLNGENQYRVVLNSVQSNYELLIIYKHLNHGWRPKTKEDYRAKLRQELYLELLKPRLAVLKDQYIPPFTQSNFNYNNINSSRTIIPFENNEHVAVKKKFINAVNTLKSISAGFTEKELSQARSTVMEAYPILQLEKSATIARKYWDHFVGGTAALAPARERELIQEILQQINLDDIEQLSQSYFSMEQNTGFLFFSDGKVEVPDFDTLKRWIAEAKAMKIEPYKDKTKTITSLQQVANIPFQNTKPIKSTSENQLGVTTMKLSNGIRLLLKPITSNSSSKSGGLNVRAFRPNGIPYRNREDFLVGQIAGEIIQHAGAGSYDKFELEEYAKTKGIRLNINMENTEQTIWGTSKVDNLEDLLQLIYLYTNNPRKDLIAFQVWKNKKQTQLSGNAARTSSGFFYDKIDAARSPEIPVMGLDDLDQLKMEDVYAIYDKWFSGFNGYTFIVTGDFDKDQLTPLLVKYLSAFPKGNMPSRDAVKASGITLKKMDETIYLSNIDQAYMKLYFPVVVPTDIKSKIILPILAKALRTRIWNRLREGCYSPGSSGRFVDSKKGLYEFMIVFDSELGNQDNMIQYAMEEFRLLRDKGIDEQLFKDLLAKEKADLGSHIAKNHLFWFDYLQEKLNSGEDSETELLQYESVLNHFITLEDVNRAAKKYLTEEYYQQFMVLPKGYQQKKQKI